jgi:lysozyme
MPFWTQKLRVLPPDTGRRRLTAAQVAWRLLALLAVLAVISPQVRFRLFTLFDYPFHYKEYKHFGIRIPRGYTVHGIDVSRYQQRVDWARVKKMQVAGVKISFAFIKSTEGSWLKDPEFAANWENARRQGIIRGAYHFFLPAISPKDQARLFIKTVRLRSGDLPPVVDVEETNGLDKTSVRKYTREFLQILEKHYKVRPILYTNRDFYKNHFADQPDFANYRFWIAHYHVADLKLPGENDWHFWQHSDRGNVNGINERVDFNVFNGDSAALRKLCLP